MREIPNRLPCFGRAADLDRLAERVVRRGVTFVMAPPRMGKTWLVRNLAFEWARPRGWNIGYAESSGGKNDLLCEVVADLYKSWLDGANVVAQAHSLWERHKDGLVGKVGGAVGKLLGKIAALADGDWVGAQKLIDEAFDALTRAEQNLRNRGSQFVGNRADCVSGRFWVLPVWLPKPGCRAGSPRPLGPFVSHPLDIPEPHLPGNSQEVKMGARKLLQTKDLQWRRGNRIPSPPCFVNSYMTTT